MGEPNIYTRENALKKFCCSINLLDVSEDFYSSIEYYDIEINFNLKYFPCVHAVIIVYKKRL